MLKTEEVEVRWYSANNSLTINGKASEEMKAQLRVIANVTHLQKAQGKDDDYNGRHSLPSSIEQSDAGKVKSLLFVIQKLKENFQIKFCYLKTKIDEIKRDLQFERPYWEYLNKQ